MSAVLIAGRRTSLLEGTEELVNLLDSVLIDRLWQAQSAPDLAKVLERVGVALDRLPGLALDLEGRQVARNRFVDLGHVVASSVSQRTSLTLLGDESNPVIGSSEYRNLGGHFSATRTTEIACTGACDGEMQKRVVGMRT